MGCCRKKLFLICGLLFLIYMSVTGQYLNMEETYDYAMLYGLIDTIIISVIMMLVPFIMRLVNKSKFKYDKGKRICRNNSVIFFIISVVLNIVFDDFGFIGGLGALIYYYINMAVFTLGIEEEPIKKKNKNKSKTNYSRYCKYCGEKLEDLSVCSNCGKKFFVPNYKIVFIVIGVIICGVLLYFGFENKEEISNIIPSFGKEYYCPDDYELRNKRCYKNDVISANKEYYCYSGSLVGTQCVTETYYPVSTKDNCPTGYSMFGFKCRKWGTTTNYDKCGSFDMTYSYATNMCYQEVYPVETKYCNFGELYGNQCIEKNYVDADYEYTCPLGYTLSYSTCEKEISISAYEK